jgi:hypothetical protein
MKDLSGAAVTNGPLIDDDDNLKASLWFGACESIVSVWG